MTGSGVRRNIGLSGWKNVRGWARTSPRRLATEIRESRRSALDDRDERRRNCRSPRPRPGLSRGTGSPSRQTANVGDCGETGSGHDLGSGRLVEMRFKSGAGVVTCRRSRRSTPRRARRPRSGGDRLRSDRLAVDPVLHVIRDQSALMEVQLLRVDPARDQAGNRCRMPTAPAMSVRIASPTASTRDFGIARPARRRPRAPAHRPGDAVFRRKRPRRPSPRRRARSRRRKA